MIKVRFQSSVHTFKLDNAFELGSSAEAIAFFRDGGILHQTNIPHTPQQTGIVEESTNTFWKLPGPLCINLSFL